MAESIFFLRMNTEATAVVWRLVPTTEGLWQATSLQQTVLSTLQEKLLHCIESDVEAICVLCIAEKCVWTSSMQLVLCRLLDFLIYFYLIDLCTAK